MKALSILQPWAHLIIHGGKDIENRTWKLPERIKGQRVAIASSLYESAEDWSAAYEIIEGRNLPIKIPPAVKLPYGSILGTVEIVDCVTASDSPWFSGPYGFVLRDPRPLATPIPYKGRLGFWTVPDAIAAQIEEQERRTV
jgi:hypothetical protein